MSGEDKLKDLAVSDSGFLFDPYTGATYSTNAVGLRIVRGLQQGLDRAGLLAALAGEFALLGDEDLGRDLDEYLHLLRSNGLVSRDFALR